MKPTVAIAIPAYNEEANIGPLIHDLLAQEVHNVVLQEIIIASDGSTDRTVEKIKEIDDPRITLYANSDRQGVAARENQTFRHAQSDILVLLNADTAVPDRQFLEKLTTPIREGRADLVSAALQELTPSTRLERILHTSMKIKEEIFLHIQNGDNVYTCHGPVRAFSSRLYKHFTFKMSVGDDAYSYLYAKTNSYTYAYVPDTYVVYKLPSRFADHQSQSLRFIKSQELLAQEFGKDVVAAHYHIPKFVAIKYAVLYMLKKPIDVISYMGVLLYMKLRSRMQNKNQEQWTISKSSKLIRS